MSATISAETEYRLGPNQRESRPGGDARPVSRIFRIILIEPDLIAASRFEITLAGAGREFLHKWFSSLRTARGLIHPDRADLILVAVPENQPDSSADWLNPVRTAYPETPVLVLATEIQTEAATNAVQRGARGYLIKNNITTDTLRRALLAAVDSTGVCGDSIHTVSEKPESMSHSG